MKRMLKAFIYACIIATISMYSVAMFWKEPLQVVIILVIISIISLLIWHSKENLILYLFCAIAGAGAEAATVALGAWEYSFANFQGIPYWLPLIWGIAGIFIKQASLEIDDFMKDWKKKHPKKS